MPTNDFLPFGNAVGANVMSQSDYLALAARPTGFVSGTANSSQLNKAWRQASIISSMLAQFIVDQSGQNAVDDGTTATLEANLLTAIRAAGRQATILTDSGTANAYAAANTPALAALPASGYLQRVNIANANTGASTYAPDGLVAKPIYGLGLQPLQGGELPPGIAVLMYLVQAGVNGGNGAWIIIESLGGASQVAPATKSLHALQLGQAQAMFSGVVGSMRNAKMNIAAASASGTFTADEIIVESALGGQTYRLANFNKTINLAGTGAGGMDTGAAPASGFVSLYAIYNPTTQASALLACNQTTSNGQIYTGANMPSGYTASALVSAWATTAASLLDIGLQVERQINVVLKQINSSTINQSNTSINIAAVCPIAAKEIGGIMQVGSSAAANCTMSLSGTAGAVGYRSVGAAVTAGTVVQASYSGVSIGTAQLIYYTANAASGVLSSIAYLNSYTI